MSNGDNVVPFETDAMKRLRSMQSQSQSQGGGGFMQTVFAPFEWYTEQIHEPLLGAGAYIFSENVRKKYTKERKAGGNIVESLGEGWREGLTDTPSMKFDLPGEGISLPFGKRLDEFQLGLKGAAEVFLDPLAVVPVGWLAKPVKAGAKAVKAGTKKTKAIDAVKAPIVKFVEQASPNNAKEAAERITKGSTDGDPNWRFYDDETKQAKSAANDARVAEDTELIQRMTDQIKAAEVSAKMTAADVSAQRGARASEAEDIFATRFAEATSAGKKGVGAEDRGAIRSALAGKYEKPTFEPLERATTTAGKEMFTPDEVNRLQQMIDDRFLNEIRPGTDRANVFGWATAQEGFTKLFTYGELPQISELKQLEKVFGTDFIRAVVGRKTGRRWQKWLEIWNIPKTIMSSFDLSAPLRQGALLMGEGSSWMRAWKPMLQSLKNPKNVDAMYQGMRDDVLEIGGRQISPMEYADRYGLEITFPGDAEKYGSLLQREEAFMGAGAVEKVPVLRSMVGRSNAAYAAFLNKARWDTWKDNLKRLGPDATEDQIRDLANNINILSGRGASVTGEKLGAILNGMFFSPKYAMSRIQVPYRLIRQAATGDVFDVSLRGARVLKRDADGKLTPAAQLSQMIARDVLGYTAGVMGMLSLARASGVIDVELDPRSSDWGKAVIAGTNIRVDPWAGLQQPMRTLAQISMQGRKQLHTGEIKDVDIADAVTTFVESKSHPSLSALLDLYSGRTFTGDDPTVLGTFVQSFTPMFIQDMVEIHQAEGLSPRMLGVAPLGLFGMSVYNIPNKYSSGDESVDLELQKNGMHIHSGGNTIRGTELTDRQQKQYDALARQEIGELLAQVFASPSYKALPNIPVRNGQSAKQLVIQRIMNRGREYARNQVWAAIQEGRDIVVEDIQQHTMSPMEQLRSMSSGGSTETIVNPDDYMSPMDKLRSMP